MSLGVHACMGCLSTALVRKAVEEKRFDLAKDLVDLLARHGSVADGGTDFVHAVIERERAEHAGRIA